MIQQRMQILHHQLCCKSLIFVCASVFAGVLGTTAGAAQPQTPDHASHAPAGPVPREILDRPVPLRIGIGKVHEKVSTSSAEAQSFYDQGLAYLHSFVWIEAIRSFHQALRADPNLAMAYLGLADGYVGLHDPAIARAAFERAKSFEKKLNERELGWLAIREAEVAYAEDGMNPDVYVTYRKAVSDALKKN